MRRMAQKFAKKNKKIFKQGNEGGSAYLKKTI
jgi:hypothetical protein